MDFSNKTLAWFVLAAVVVSMTGTLISLNGLNITGFASDNKTGNASVSISSTTTLNFAVNALDFGSGEISTSSPYYCEMSNFNSTTILQNGTSGTGCLGFNPTTPYLQIENAGTAKFNVSINFSGVASAIIGGGQNAPIVAPQIKWKAANNGTEYASCPDIGAGNYTAWNNVSGTTAFQICLGPNGLGTADNNDSMTIGINITLPHDTPANTKKLDITATGYN